MSDTRLDSAYAACRQQARDHYENFPVASWALPARLRGPVAAVYTFARRADDIADEGELAPAQRLQGLQQMQEVLESGAAPDLPWLALHDTRQRYALPVQDFRDLLLAFRQDLQQTRYADFGELKDYCRGSANPVGRILLRLFRADHPRHLAQSDAICSALQLINFLQDVQADLQQRDRVYLPQDELRRFGLTEQDLMRTQPDPRLQALVRFQADRARRLLQSGAALGRELPGRLGLEIRMITLGGWRILNKIHQRGHFGPPTPRLQAWDWARIIIPSLLPAFGKRPNHGPTRTDPK